MALDCNIEYVALPDIGNALEFSPQSVQWVVSACAVGLGGLLLFGGRAVDRLGPRRMFLYLAGWTSAAVTVACGPIALALGPTLQPQQTSPSEGASK